MALSNNMIYVFAFLITFLMVNSNSIRQNNIFSTRIIIEPRCLIAVIIILEIFVPFINSLLLQ